MDFRSFFYRVNDETLFIRPTVKNNAVSEIEELDETCYSMQDGFKIIDQACIRSGSSYQGRADAMKAIFDIKYYPPIPINPTKNLYAFSTESPHNYDCIWVMTNNIKMVKKRERNSIIYFKNGKRLLIPVSKRRMEIILGRLYQYHIYFKNL